jgi:hypothetical protein
VSADGSDDFAADRAAKQTAQAATARENQAARAKACRDAVAELISTAKREDNGVSFDVAPLFGPIVADSAQKHIAIGVEGHNVVIPRAKLAEVARVTRKFPEVTASLSLRDAGPVLAIRWVCGQHRGGLDLRSRETEVKPGDGLVAIIFPVKVGPLYDEGLADLFEQAEAALAA